MSTRIIITDNIYRPISTTIKEINPYSDEDNKLVINYDEENKTNYSNILNDIKQEYPKEDYDLLRMTDPTFQMLIYKSKGQKIEDLCLTFYERDLKSFSIYLDEKNKNIYKEATQYAFKNMNMQSVNVFVDKNDKNLIQKLLNDEYIPLFDQNDKDSDVVFLKENEENYNEKGNIICV